jgi:hypothetical protein
MIALKATRLPTDHLPFGPVFDDYFFNDILPFYVDKKRADLQT